MQDWFSQEAMLSLLMIAKITVTYAIAFGAFSAIAA